MITQQRFLSAIVSFRTCPFTRLIHGLAALLAGSVAAVADPSWWLDPATYIYDQPQNTQNWFPVNVGQLKHVATQAKKHLDLRLAGVGGAGSAVTAITTFTNSGNFSPLNVGQLKNVAKPFYDRLAAVNYNWQTGTYGTASQPYPWTGTTHAQNGSPVNLGQLKNIFSFSIEDADADGLPDYWENHFFGAGASLDPTNAFADNDNDGVSNLQEYMSGLSPVSASTIPEMYPDALNWSRSHGWNFEGVGTPSGSGAIVSNDIATGGQPLRGYGTYSVESGFWGSGLRLSGAAGNYAKASWPEGGEDWSVSLFFKLDHPPTVSTHWLFSVCYEASGYTGHHVRAGITAPDASGNCTLSVSAGANSVSLPVICGQAYGAGWHHLGLANGGANGKLEVYFEGMRVGNLTAASIDKTKSPAFFAGSVRVGTSTFNCLDGMVDEIRLYQTKLPAPYIDFLAIYPASSSARWTLEYLLAHPYWDYDNDGFSDLAEVIAGSDPKNASSLPSLPVSTIEVHTPLN